MSRESPALRQALLDGLRRAGRAILACLVVGASLFVFPNAVPWMIAAWLLAYTIVSLRGRQGWLLLAACFAIVAVKGTPWLPGLIALAVAAGIVAVARALLLRFKIATEQRVVAVSLAVLWLAWGVMLFDWHTSMHASRRPQLQPDRPVVCLGDSLTAFDPPSRGYPVRLKEKISLPIVNLGWPGSTTAGGLSRIDRVLEASPQAVVIEFTGNDAAQGRSRQEVEEAYERIVAACREAGAEVILIEVPRGYITDPYLGLERRLARKYDLELIPDTILRRLWLSGPVLPPGSWTSGPYLTESDGIHPNQRGEDYLAQQVAARLKRLFSHHYAEIEAQ